MAYQNGRRVDGCSEIEEQGVCFQQMPRTSEKEIDMTIGNALNFIERGLHDSGLRRQLNAASDVAECQKVLDKEELTFSAHDFDEAFHHRLTQCQEEEEADQLREFKMWWELLSASCSTDACGGQCSGCC